MIVPQMHQRKQVWDFDKNIASSFLDATRMKNQKEAEDRRQQHVEDQWSDLVKERELGKEMFRKQHAEYQNVAAQQKHELNLEKMFREFKENYAGKPIEGGLRTAFGWVPFADNYDKWAEEEWRKRGLRQPQPVDAPRLVGSGSDPIPGNYMNPYRRTMGIDPNDILYQIMNNQFQNNE